MAWADVIVPKLKGMAKALFLPGRFVGDVDGRMAFALENEAHRKRAEPYRAGVESVLAAHFRRPVPLTLVLDGASSTKAAVAPPQDEVFDPAEFVDAGRHAPEGSLERLTRAFPGAEVIEEDR